MFYVDLWEFHYYRTNEWYGIRYAQPPVGELRWQAPQDIEYHNNYTLSPLDATAPGPFCTKGLPAWFGAGGSFGAGGIEDCLRLDVLVPAEPASTSLPVMVQIHGGGKLGSQYPLCAKLTL